MGSAYLTKQRSVLKVYLLNMIEKKKLHGWQYLQELKEELKPFGYQPSHSEIYKSLHELTEEGILQRSKQLRNKEEGGFQEIVLYHLLESGRGKADAYKRLVKQDLDRSQQLLKKIINDNY